MFRVYNDNRKDNPLMKLKRIVVFVLIISIICSLSACGGNASTDNTTAGGDNTTGVDTSGNVMSEEDMKKANNYIYSGGIDATFDADVYMIPCIGQSLAVNTDAGPSTFDDVYPLSYDTSLKNINLQDMNTGFCEAFDLMAEEYGVEIPEDFQIITCVVGTGDVSVNTFLKGTEFFRDIIINVKQAYNKCKKAGLTMVVPGFMWTQGEADMRCGGNYPLYGSGDWNPYEYSDKLASIISDLNTEIKKITGQTQDIFCYSYQVACQNTYTRYPRIALEQLELSLINEQMILAKTMYDVNYNVADYTHAPAATYRNMGNYYGMACFVTSVLHKKFEYTHVTSVDNNGTEIILNYEVPCAPLTLDTTLVNQLEDGNYGFCIYNMPDEITYSKTTVGITVSETKITKVEIVDGTKVKLTLNQPMTEADILTYGVNGLGYENVNGYNITGSEQRSGHETGARGCLRDSSPVKNNNKGSVLHDLYSWATIFEYKITK